jgi:O-antigen ligase
VPVDLTALTGAASILLGSVVLVRRKTSRRLGIEGAFCLVAMIFLATGSLLWSSNLDEGARRIMLSPLLVVAIGVGGVVIAPERERVRRVLVSLVLLGGWAGWINVNAVLQGGVAVATGLVLGHSGDYIGRGIMAAQAGTIAFVSLLFAGGRLAQFTISFALWAAAALGVMVSGARQALVALAVAMALASMRLLRNPASYSRNALGAVVALACAAALVSQVDALGFNLTTLERIEYTRESGTLGSREVWTFAWKEIAERPLIGHGLGSFGTVANTFPTDHPHNLFLEIMFELGALGLLVLLALGSVLWRAWPGWRKATGDPLGLAISCITLLTFVSAMVSNSWAENRILFGLVGISCGFAWDVSPERKQGA